MIVRTAILEGTVAPEHKAEFDQNMRTTVVAAYLKNLMNH